MYYHIKIELNEKNKKDYHTNLSELDKTNIDEVIKDTMLPYLQEIEFLFDGRMLTKNDIRSIKIYETEQASQILVEMEDNRNRNNQWFFASNKENVVAYDRYSKDITKNIFKDASKNINKKDTDISEKHDTNKVFIVHGHDSEAKLEVARFIDKIGFEPIILHEQASDSKTIIEKIESYSNVGFAIVIYTACDVGAKKSDSSNLKNRARQNVVFEHGFLMGKLGRSNICSLVKGEIETPNDISGIVYTSMDSGHWQIELAKEMKTSGYKVDMNKVI
ncbi:MAG: nucleotide-binding protein [Sulfurimonas sp.]|nr:nucleotide-binding protein [Sulfurimonas sp.]